MQGLLCSSIKQAVPRYDIDPMTFYLVWTGHGTAPVFGCSDSARIVPLAWLLTLPGVLGISAQRQWAKYDIKLSENEKCSEWQMNQKIYKETNILLISRSSPDREFS